VWDLDVANALEPRFTLGQAVDSDSSVLAIGANTLTRYDVVCVIIIMCIIVIIIIIVVNIDTNALINTKLFYTAIF
jgi:cell division protein FtsL